MNDGALSRRDLLAGSLAASLAWPGAANAAGATSVDFEQGRLRGFTTTRLPQLDDAMMDALAATGARLIRVALRFTRCAGCQVFAPTADEWKALPAVLARARQRRLLVVLVAVFGTDDRASGLWESPLLQDSFVAQWAAIATRVGQDTALAGFDLLNEPHPGGSIAQAQDKWRRLALRAVAAIRSLGSTVHIVFEPVAGGNTVGLQGFEPLPDANVVYSTHFYTPHDITHQHVSAHWTHSIPYPAGPEWGLGAWDRELGVGRIDRDRLVKELRVARDFQQRHRVPMYVGEFSCVRWAPGNSALRYVSDCLSIFQEFGWSWTYHSFREWPGWDAEIASTSREARTRSATAPVMQALKAALQRS